MKLLNNTSLTSINGHQIKDLYATGKFIQERSATHFSITRNTIAEGYPRAFDTLLAFL